jgi:hypothetical protein
MWYNNKGTLLNLDHAYEIHIQRNNKRKIVISWDNGHYTIEAADEVEAGIILTDLANYLDAQR